MCTYTFTYISRRALSCEHPTSDGAGRELLLIEIAGVKVFAVKDTEQRLVNLIAVDLARGEGLLGFGDDCLDEADNLGCLLTGLDDQGNIDIGLPGFNGGVR